MQASKWSMGWCLRVALCAAVLALTACASSIPEGIRKAPPGGVSPAEARADGERLQGTTVRWGGVIAAVENRREDTWLEVVARPLASDGSPKSGDAPDMGRFLARVPGFLDPAVYAEGRALTVRGTFADVQTRPIGDYPYRYPVVRVRQHYLWAQEPEPVSRPYDPFWYDPWYPFPWWHRPPYYW